MFHDLPPNQWLASQSVAGQLKRSPSVIDDSDSNTHDKSLYMNECARCMPAQTAVRGARNVWCFCVIPRHRRPQPRSVPLVLTIGYSDEDGKQQALVFEVDKHSVRSALASLEARNGRKMAFDLLR